jgi:hypothetical protein
MKSRVARILTASILLATGSLPAWSPAYARPIPGDGTGTLDQAPPLTAPGDPTAPAPLIGTIVADPSLEVSAGPAMDARVLTTVPNGGIYGVVCYMTGDSDNSGWGGTNPNWDLLMDLANNNKLVGFAADVWIDTNGNIDGQTRQCAPNDTAGVPALAAASNLPVAPAGQHGRAPLFVDCQPSTDECFLSPWPQPDATAQANLARMATNGGHLVMDGDHKLFVVPAHEQDFAPYPLWTGSYAPPGYELYLCTNCFDASDAKHEFAHPIVYLHTLGEPVSQEVNTHAPADPHDLRVDSSVHFASDLQPRVGCDAPCDPADYWRRLGLVLGAPFVAAAAPVLIENWLLPAAENQLTSIGTAAWTRVATATGLSLPVVERIVQQLEEGAAPETLGEDAVKVSQELETEATQPATAAMAEPDPFGYGLRSQFRQQQIDAMFDENGDLRPDIVTDPATKEIINGTRIGNGNVVKSLTADGSNLSDWGKYETKSYYDFDGKTTFKFHFYFNRVTGATNFLYDYKVKFNLPGQPQIPVPDFINGARP